MIINTYLLPPGTSALTVWPFIFIDPRFCGQGWKDTFKQTITHERVHLTQQRRWVIYGLGVGLLVWWFLYLFALPFWYNPWRRKWETEAYRAGQGYNDEMITTILRQSPYFLR